MSNQNLSSQDNLNQSTENNLNAFMQINTFIADHPEIDDGTAMTYGRINSLSNQHGYCWANNYYLASLAKVSERQIQRRLQILRKLDFIRYYQKDGKRIIITCSNYGSPKIKELSEITECHPLNVTPDIDVTPPRQKCHPTHDKNVTHNNIIEKNNLNNITTTPKSPNQGNDAVDALTQKFIDAGLDEEQVERAVEFYESNESEVKSKRSPIGFVVWCIRNNKDEEIQSMEKKIAMRMKKAGSMEYSTIAGYGMATDEGYEIASGALYTLYPYDGANEFWEKYGL